MPGHTIGSVAIYYYEVQLIKEVFLEIFVLILTIEINFLLQVVIVNYEIPEVSLMSDDKLYVIAYQRLNQFLNKRLDESQEPFSEVFLQFIAVY